MNKPNKAASTPKDRKEAMRKELLSDMKKQIKNGTLVCRQMTKAEKDRYSR